jgi:PIN domain nuclease of toxin-antitoxin system
MLHDLGRTAVGLPEVRVAIEERSLSFLPLDLDQLDEFAVLSSIRDPFDRLIVAAARWAGAELITRDEALAESGLVMVVWS